MLELLGEELDINVNIKPDHTPFLNSLERAFPGGEIKPILLFETSRGCWWGERQRCAFCGLNGPALCFRPMRPEQAVEQISSLFKYSDRCSFLESVDTVLPRGYLGEVFPALRPPAGIKIQYEVRPDLRDVDLQVLGRAGVTVLQPGIESLSTATLQRMRKGTTAFQNLAFLKACAKYPVEIGWNLLIYAPGESEAVYERYLHDLPLLTHLHPPQTACLVGFVRFSQYFEQAADYGLDLRPEDFYGLTFPFDEASIFRLATKFYDANADTARMEHWLGKLNEAIAWWRTRWLNQDHRAEARLGLLGEGKEAAVYDSRSGTPLEHPVDEATVSLLEYLERPRRRSDIRVAFRERPQDVERALSFVKERGLIFEEDGRLFSLVVR